jgi:hypothetical protein
MSYLSVLPEGWQAASLDAQHAYIDEHFPVLSQNREQYHQSRQVLYGYRYPLNDPWSVDFRLEAICQDLEWTRWRVQRFYPQQVQEWASRLSAREKIVMMEDHEVYLARLITHVRNITDSFDEEEAFQQERGLRVDEMFDWIVREKAINRIRLALLYDQYSTSVDERRYAQRLLTEMDEVVLAETASHHSHRTRQRTRQLNALSREQYGLLAHRARVNIRRPPPEVERQQAEEAEEEERQEAEQERADREQHILQNLWLQQMLQEDQPLAQREETMGGDVNAVLSLRVKWSDLMDPVSHELLVDPVILSDGITYNRSTVRELARNGINRSPVTRQPFTPGMMNNQLIRNLLESYPLSSIQSRSNPNYHRRHRPPPKQKRMTALSRHRRMKKKKPAVRKTKQSARRRY